MSEFEIRNLPLEQMGAIRPLLEQSAFKPMRYLERELGNDLGEFWFASIAELVKGKNAQAFAAFRDQKVAGLLVYADNPWETGILNKKAGVLNYFVIEPPETQGEHMAQALLEEALSYASARGVQFLLCKPSADASTAIHALESQGFQLMDTLIDCYCDFRHSPTSKIPPPGISDNVVIRLATGNDMEELVAVARVAFRHHFGRYHADPRIGSELATRFYEEWIKSSIGGYADWVCVAEIAGRIAGFAIWKKPSHLENGLKLRVGHYSIAGIHPDYSGRRLFTALTYEGMKLLEGVADVVEGPTHVNNYGVQMGYSKLHWRVCVDARHSFHRWL